MDQLDYLSCAPIPTNQPSNQPNKQTNKKPNN